MLSNLVIEGNGSHFALSSKTKTGCTIKHFVQISLQLKYSSSLLTICTFHKQVEHALIQFFATLQQELPFLQFSRTWSSFSLDVSPLLCAQLLQWGLTLCDLMKSCRLLCLWDSPGKNTGVGCHSLLQKIFPTQGLNPGLLHHRQIIYFTAEPPGKSLIPHWITLNIYISINNLFKVV